MEEKITVAGMGYVGLSLAILLSRTSRVTIYEINAEKVADFQAGKLPIQDRLMYKYLQEEKLSLEATDDPERAFSDASLIVIATPTNYDPKTNAFDTSSVESVLRLAEGYAPEAVAVIKSTVPIGYSRTAQAHFSGTVLFSPEFLREGQALYDNLYPSRIVVGMAQRAESQEKAARRFAALLRAGALEKEVPILLMGSDEAEAVKLFSNTYLAMRVAFFNELDTYAKVNGLRTKEIIDGVSLDPRIGNYYNNPSFGYGGYCLPKDTKQLRSNYGSIPQDLIKAIVRSNRTRKEFIASDIAALAPKTAGIYLLAMKAGSDNFRESSVLDIIRLLREKGIQVLIYEPALKESSYLGATVVRNLAQFKLSSDMIVCNRVDENLNDVEEKLYTRDIFHIG